MLPAQTCVLVVVALLRLVVLLFPLLVLLFPLLVLLLPLLVLLLPLLVLLLPLLVLLLQPPPLPRKRLPKFHHPQLLRLRTHLLLPLHLRKVTMAVMLLLEALVAKTAQKVSNSKTVLTVGTKIPSHHSIPILTIPLFDSSSLATLSAIVFKRKTRAPTVMNCAPRLSLLVKRRDQAALKLMRSIPCLVSRRRLNKIRRVEIVLLETLVPLLLLEIMLVLRLLLEIMLVLRLLLEITLVLRLLLEVMQALRRQRPFKHPQQRLNHLLQLHKRPLLRPQHLLLPLQLHHLKSVL
jgi:hypothetical protein